jgi:hypothetical protein
LRRHALGQAVLHDRETFPPPSSRENRKRIGVLQTTDGVNVSAIPALRCVPCSPTCLEETCSGVLVPHPPDGPVTSTIVFVSAAGIFHMPLHAIALKITRLEAHKAGRHDLHCVPWRCKTCNCIFDERDARIYMTAGTFPGTSISGALTYVFCTALLRYEEKCCKLCHSNGLQTPSGTTIPDADDVARWAAPEPH